MPKHYGDFSLVEGELRKKYNFWQRLFRLPLILLKYNRDWKEARLNAFFGRFITANPQYFIIVADPKSDKIMGGYGGYVVGGHIKDKSGRKNLKVVQSLIDHSDFNKKSDTFLVALMDIFKIHKDYGGMFLKWIDGALFNISKKLLFNKDKKN